MILALSLEGGHDAVKIRSRNDPKCFQFFIVFLAVLK
jgi:hypothetical protein